MKNETWSGEKLTIRPSAIDGFFNCAKQWAGYHLYGNNSIPGGRAAIGTSVHVAAEVLWTDAILSKTKDTNMNKLKDAAIIKMQELDKEGVQYDSGETLNTAEETVLKGVEAFVGDIVPFTDIPLFVEERFSIDLDHPVISRLSGTVDYISADTIADVKTSKRKPSPQSHVTQQSVYKMLAEANGHKTEFSVIQGIAFLKASTNGHVMPLIPDIPTAKRLVNTMLDTLDLFYEDKVDPKLLFRGNPKYYLCSHKYCAFYKDCEYT